jgi:hypothetical protein
VPKLKRVSEGEDDAAGADIQKAPVAPYPEVWGHGVSSKLSPSGYVAYRISNRGQVEVLSPLRHGKVAGETKHSAQARMMAAISRQYLGGRGD